MHSAHVLFLRDAIRRGPPGGFAHALDRREPQGRLDPARPLRSHPRRPRPTRSHSSPMPISPPTSARPGCSSRRSISPAPCSRLRAGASPHPWWSRAARAPHAGGSSSTCGSSSSPRSTTCRTRSAGSRPSTGRRFPRLVAQPQHPQLRLRSRAADARRAAAVTPPIRPVAIAWIDSEAASTTTALTPYLSMLQSAAELHRSLGTGGERAEAFASALAEMTEPAFDRAVSTPWAPPRGARSLTRRPSRAGSSRPSSKR